jgi:hypothetical protein
MTIDVYTSPARSGPNWSDPADNKIDTAGITVRNQGRDCTFSDYG